MKRRKTIIPAILIIAVLILTAGFAWRTAGRRQIIHTEVRTAHMAQVESTVPDGILQVQELLVRPAKQSGVTLHRAAYYPQAETLVCFFEGEDPNRDIYPAALPNVNPTILPEKHGITVKIFENVPPEALSDGVTVELTDWQFESCHPVTFVFDR